MQSCVICHSPFSPSIASAVFLTASLLDDHAELISVLHWFSEKGGSGEFEISTHPTPGMN